MILLCFVLLWWCHHSLVDSYDALISYIQPCERRHIHYLWNTNMAAWLHHGNNLPQELNCLTSLGRSTSHIGNNTKLSSLSIDRQMKFNITAWPKLGNKAAENGNKSIKYTGSYFTAVNASSWDKRRCYRWQLFWRHKGLVTSLLTDLIK